MCYLGIVSRDIKGIYVMICIGGKLRFVIIMYIIILYYRFRGFNIFILQYTPTHSYENKIRVFCVFIRQVQLPVTFHITCDNIADKYCKFLTFHRKYIRLL